VHHGGVAAVASNQWRVVVVVCCGQGKTLKPLLLFHAHRTGGVLLFPVFLFLDELYVLYFCQVSCDEQGMAVFDAFQLSPQCLEMVAEGALLPLPGKPNYCAVHETFTAMVEAKPAKAIDTDFFLANVPITSFSSAIPQGELARKLGAAQASK
jgi:hypothetical protein